MAFRAESAMVAAAQGGLAEHFGGQDGVVLPEFEYTAGRADAVVVRQSPSYLERRIHELGVDQPITDDGYLRCFLQIHSRPRLTEEYYLGLGGLSQGKKRRALDWLIEAGFVESTRDGKLQSAPYLRPHVTTAVSIEFKLRRWDRALAQAFRGKAFAHYQYVALDQDRIDPALENLQRFRRLNVGLASINSDGAVTVHHAPSKNQPFSPVNRWALNEETLDC